MCIRLCSVFFQLRVINNDNFICAIFSQLVCKSFNITAYQNCRYFRAKVFCKVFSLAYQFQSDSTKYIVYLLCKDKYSLIILNIHFNILQ